MGPVIGGILPLAVGIAISPIPIIAVIVTLLSPKAHVASVGFLLGWIVGIALTVTVFTLLASILPEPPDGPRPIVGAIQLLLGAALIALAVAQWRKRPKPGESPTMPGWMAAIDKASFVGAFGLGLLLSALNPKSLVLATSAGLTIGSAQLDAGSIVLVIALFTLLAASTVLVPVVGYLFAAERLTQPLVALRAWLEKQNSIIMTVLLLVIGVVLIGNGIAAF